MSDQDNLEKRFHEGLCLAAGGDFDQANGAFLDCVIGEPGCGEFVQEFLGNLGRRFPAGSGGEAPQGSEAEPVQRAAAQADWIEVLRRAPRLLADHPWHTPTLLALAEACAAQGYAKAEGCYLRAAFAAAKDDIRVHRRAGEAFARLRKYDEALACWRRVETLDPKDEEAPRLVAALTIAKCRQQGGLESSNEAAPPSGASDKRHTRSVRRPVFRHTASLAAGATHPSGLSLSAIQQLEAAIRDRPSIPELYLRLAQLYLDKDRDYDAEKLLAKGREATDHDSQVQQMWEEVTMLRHARRVEIAEQEIKSADPAAADKAREALALAKREQDRTDLEIFRGRVKRQPESAANHYELGVRLKRADKLREACEHLEKALGGSEERCAAAFELGDCHAQLGDLPQALRYYRLAAETPAAVGPSEAQKESLYQAGKLARRVKLAKLANRYLTQLVRIDPHHRDTAALVQST